MRGAGIALASLAWLFVACGKYGPPERPKPVSPIEERPAAERPADDEKKDQPQT